MLYDKRWDKTAVKADPFTLDSLIAWLEKQPADDTYCYIDNGMCLLAQYFTASGFSRVSVYSTKFQWHDGQRKLPPHFNKIAIGLTMLPERTFGAALERANRIKSRRRAQH